MIEYDIDLPSHYGKVVEDRLKTLEMDVEYQGYTINDRAEIIQTNCSIQNNGSWNYHNNYDNSENVLMVGNESKWWTIDKSEAIDIQRKNLDKIIEKHREESIRLESIYPYLM